MPKNDDVKIATELYEKLPEHEKKLAAALINATAAQLLAISMAYGDKVNSKTSTEADSGKLQLDLDSLLDF